MADILQITARIQTADVEGAGSEELLYLGIGGREFVLDRPGRTDLRRGEQADYVLGENSNVMNPDDNDPRFPQLDTDDLDRYPVYLRLHPSTSRDVEVDWSLERARVTVQPSNAKVRHYFDQPYLIGGDRKGRIKLGARAGVVLYLKRSDAEPVT
ncbi:hypothetical protein AB0E74_22825 [Streptomyces sp. NPDC030392]|uniref:hypothetical protein n=1 Tax=Streptomyces sp. NPDC030392 TaxID=3155468 RepID=UPI0033CCFBA4